LDILLITGQLAKALNKDVPDHITQKRGKLYL